MSLYLGENLISGVATPTEPTRNLGQIIESIVPLQDAGLHLLDGALINGSGIYSDFVTAIGNLVSDYPDLFTTEASWQTSVTTYGVCGKFVYDSVANTVRLPKITGILEGTTDVTALGDLVQAGLPILTTSTTGAHTHTRGTMNITGSLNNSAGDECFYKNAATGTGAITASNAYSSHRGTNSNGGTTTRGFDFNAANSWTGSTSSEGNHSHTTSWSGHNNSSTVQPQTIKCYYYIVIATTTKTEIEVDIDQVTTDLNGKADVDFTNVTNVANIKMAHNAMPSNTYVDLTLGASGAWYTAPADGFITFRKQASASGQYMQVTTGSGRQFWVQSSSADGLVAVAIPVSKGESYAVSYTLAGTSYQVFRFIYAVGSESEA